MANIISSSNYDVEEKLLDLASVFFDIAETSTLKTGMLGYTVASMAQVARENIFHRNALYKERFLNSASLPSSIYNFAKLYNYNVSMAKPSVATLNIMLPVSWILQQPVDDSGKRVIVVPRDIHSGGASGAFTMEKFEFRLPYSVRIVWSGSGQATARYDISEDNTIGEAALAYASNPFLRTWVDTVGFAQSQSTYLYVLVDVYQMTKSSSKWEIYSNDITEQLLFDQKFVDQVADFNVYHTRGDAIRFLPKFFNVSNAAGLTEYVFYSYPDDGSVQLYFSASSGGFRPTLGSKISLDMYSTKGTAGNFTFKGNVVYSGYASIPLVAALVQQPGGGADRMSLKDTKREIMDVATLRGNIITESDLNVFFQSTIKSKDPEARISFRKRRDDIISRIFSAHVLVKDPDGYAVPTNTIDMDVPYQTIEERDFVFRLGSVAIYDVVDGKYRFLRQDEYPDRYLSDPDALAYALPYLMEVRLSPPRILYADTNADQQVGMNFEFANENVSRVLMPGNVTLVRNPITESGYALSCGLLASGEDFDPQDARIIGVMSSGGARICWFELEGDGSGGYYAHFDTSDHFDTAGRLVLKPGPTPLMGFDSANTPLTQIQVGPDVELILTTFYDQGGTVSYSWWEDPDLQGIRALGQGTEAVDLSGMELATKLRSSSTVTFFRPMNDVMHTQVVVKDNGVIRLTDVPLVGLRYFYNTQKNGIFYRTINNHIAVIRSGLSRLENNFDVDLKLYNTYGRSVLYDTANVHLSIDLSIKLNVASTAELDVSIKEAIRAFVAASNDLPTRKVSVSNLITYLETGFPQISYIVFNGVNGLNIQAINYLYTEDEIREQRIRCAPEFVSVALVDAGASALRSSEPNVKITYI